MVLVVKNQLANTGIYKKMRDQFLGWKDPLEKSMATQSNILAWRIPRTEEPGGLQFIGSQRAGHD